jgi:glycosyltransferase involved in cell wall biosynthesis
MFGDELVSAYAAADVFVFPSKTDTFGLVIIEALACGVPVAAYPVTGPIDILNDRRPVRWTEDLDGGDRGEALTRDRADLPWPTARPSPGKRARRQFLGALVPAFGDEAAAA